MPSGERPAEATGAGRENKVTHGRAVRPRRQEQAGRVGVPASVAIGRLTKSSDLPHVQRKTRGKVLPPRREDAEATRLLSSPDVMGMDRNWTTNPMPSGECHRAGPWTGGPKRRWLVLPKGEGSTRKI